MLKFQRKSPTDYLTYLVIILSGVIIDQLTKWLAVLYLKPMGTLPIIEDVLHFTYVENRGAAFGMLADNRAVFMIISSVMIVALSVYLFGGLSGGKLYSLSVAMIISGGVGNMIDRTLLGYVVDFIDVRLIDFAVFNAADSLVCVGAGILILALILDLIKEAREKREGKSTDDGEN